MWDTVYLSEIAALVDEYDQVREIRIRIDK